MLRASHPDGWLPTISTRRQVPDPSECRPMRARSVLGAASIVLTPLLVAEPAVAQDATDAPDVIAELVGRLTLDNYKSTLKGLTQFGDRRQGTQRNRDAVDWIEVQLQAFGCTNTERVHYMYPDPPRPEAQSGQRRAPQRRPPQARAPEDLTTATGGRVGRRGPGPGGSMIFGHRGRTGVNRDLMAQPDERIRALNAEEPVDGERSQVYCTKVGTTRPDEMYIVGAHMDGHGVNEAVNDDGSGTALVMELARIFSAPDVETEVSIRFALWNNEETGLNGARAYVAQRQELQGIEDPAGSGTLPRAALARDDPARHDALGPWCAPGPDGVVSRDQRPEADVNVEFQSASELATESMQLAFFFKSINEQYATDYPATVGPHMTNTDSTPFMNIVPSISLQGERTRGTGRERDGTRIGTSPRTCGPPIRTTTSGSG